MLDKNVNIYDSKIDFACKWLSKLHVAFFKIFLRSLIYVQLCILPKNWSFLMSNKLLHKNLIIYRASQKKVGFAYINYFYQILKFCKDWITESEKIFKIVRRKFAIFSSGLIFKEKFFKSSSSFLLSIV